MKTGWWTNPFIVVPSVVAIIASVLGAVLSVVLAGNPERVPEVARIHPDQFGIGQTFDVYGTNLDLVEAMVKAQRGIKHPLGIFAQDNARWRVVLAVGPDEG